MMVRTVFKGVASIHRTCKQKSDRHNYYVEESVGVRRAIEDFRSGMQVDKLKSKYKNVRVGTFY